MTSSNSSVFGKSCTTHVLKGSNSIPLKIGREAILSHSLQASGSNGPMPSAWCRAQGVEENLVPSEVDEAQLIVLSNLESYNAEMVKRGLDQGCRLEALNRAAREQLSLLLRSGAAEGLESGRMSSEHGLPPVS